jgi:hypothetical protein
VEQPSAAAAAGLLTSIHATTCRIVFMRTVSSLAAAVSLLSLGACCCGVTPSADGALAGEWRYDLVGARAEGDPVACSFTGISVRLAHSGNRLTGSTGGGAGHCAGADGKPLPAVPLRPATVEGTVDGARVVLDFGDFLRSEGTLANDEITGTAVFDARARGTFTLRRR